MEFSETLKNNYEFRRVYGRGKSIAAARLVLYCLKNKQNKNRLGITVSAKLGIAVQRNLLRRRIREIYRLNESRFSCGYDLVVVVRARGMHATYAELERDFLHLAEKMGVMK